MNIWIEEGGKLIPYQRLGACKACGLCCCSMHITAQVQVDYPGNPDSDEQQDNDYSGYEGFSVFRAQGLWWWWKIEVNDKPRDKPCDSFISGKCNFWKQDDWPAICRYWPVHPDNLEQFPECGFSFERLDK